MADDDTNSNLTTEQKDFLEECLVEFANRYTDDDEEYKKVYERGITLPPIVDPWSGRPRLVAKRYSGGRNSYQHRNYDRNYQDRDRGYDRERGYNEPRYSRNDRNHEDSYNRRYRPY